MVETLVKTTGCSNRTMTPHINTGCGIDKETNITVKTSLIPIENTWTVLKSQVPARKHTHLIELQYINSAKKCGQISNKNS